LKPAFVNNFADVSPDTPPPTIPIEKFFERYSVKKRQESSIVEYRTYASDI
jgi:hypothetical protein